MSFFNGIIRVLRVKQVFTRNDVANMCRYERNAGARTFFETPQQAEDEVKETVRRDGILGTDYLGVVHNRRIDDESSA